MMKKKSATSEITERFVAMKEKRGRGEVLVFVRKLKEDATELHESSGVRALSFQEASPSNPKEE